MRAFTPRLRLLLNWTVRTTSLSDEDARHTRQFLEELNRFLARGLSLTDDPSAIPVGTPREKLIAQRDAFLSLYRICERILLQSQRLSQLGVGTPELELLHAQSERVLDVVDWFDALSAPGEIEAQFRAGEAEFAHGDILPWSAIP